MAFMSRTFVSRANDGTEYDIRPEELAEETIAAVFAYGWQRVINDAHDRHAERYKALRDDKYRFRARSADNEPFLKKLVAQWAVNPLRYKTVSAVMKLYAKDGAAMTAEDVFWEEFAHRFKASPHSSGLKGEAYDERMNELGEEVLSKLSAAADAQAEAAAKLRKAEAEARKAALDDIGTISI